MESSQCKCKREIIKTLSKRTFMAAKYVKTTAIKQ